MEKYGTIPKKFTREWWEYLWTYYKFHIITVMVIIALIIYTVNAVTSTKNYDLTAYVVTQDIPPADSALKNLEDKLTSLSEDVTGNGKTETTVKFDVFASDPNSLYVEYTDNMTKTTKFIAEATRADNQIYIVDKNTADIMVSYGCMLPVSDWADNSDTLNVYEEYFLSLSGMQSFSDLNFDCENLYIGVLVPKEDSNNYELKMKMFENAKKVANQLIKE